MIFSQRKIKYGFLETVSSGGTLTLTDSSLEVQIITGTMNHTVVLPDATTLVKDIAFKIINESTGTVTVNRNGGSLLVSVPAAGAAFVILTNKSTAPGVWSVKQGSEGTGSGLATSVNPSIKTSNYTIQPSDNDSVIKIDTSAGPIDITLPAPSAGFKVTIKDVGSIVSLNNVSIIRSGSELIDGVQADDRITKNLSSTSYISDGTDWSRLDSLDKNLRLSGRGLIAGGSTGSVSNVIDYVRISTLGNAVDFGDLFQARRILAACSSSIKGFFGGGFSGTDLDTVDYVTIATLANAVDFFDLTISRRGLAACSNNSRGIFAGGFNGVALNTIDYIEFTSTGNSADFGDLTVARQDVSSCSNSKKGFFGGGTTGTVQNVIDYVFINAKSNAVDFGDLTTVRYTVGACSNHIIGLFGGGIQTPTTPVNNIDFLVLATTGNAVDFGDLTVARYYPAAFSSSTRAVWSGGTTGGPTTDVIDYVTIATLGNAVDFGDLSVSREQAAGCSSSHGGLYV